MASITNETFKLYDASSSSTKKLTNAVGYLKNLTPQILVDDKLAYEAVFLIASLLDTETPTLLNLDCEKLFANILLELYKVASEIDFVNFNINIENQSSQDLTKNDRRISLLAFTLQIINFLASRSIRFCATFAQNNGLHAHITFLYDVTVLNKIIDVQLNNLSSSKTVASTNLVNRLVTNMCALSSVAELNSALWSESNAVDIFLKIAKIKTSTSLSALVSVCNLLSEDEIEARRERLELDKLVSTLCKMLSQCTQELSEGRVDRRQVQILDDERRIVDGQVSYIIDDGDQWRSIVFMVRGLNKICVNDQLRSLVYFENRVKDHLMVMFEHGNEIEQKCGLKLLDKLTLTKAISEDVVSDEALVEYLKSENSTDDLAEIKRRILSNLNIPTEPVFQTDQADQPDQINQIDHTDQTTDKFDEERPPFDQIDNSNDEIVDNNQSKENSDETASINSDRSAAKCGFKLDDSSLTNIEKITNAIDYLKQMEPKFLIDDKWSYEAVFLIGKLMFEEISSIINSNCEYLFANILLELYKISSKIDFKNLVIDIENQSAENINQNDRRIGLIAFVLHIVNYLASKSLKFNARFVKNNGLTAHISFLQNDSFLEKVMDVRLVNFSSEYHDLIDYLVINLSVLEIKYDESNNKNANFKIASTNEIATLIKISKLKPSTELCACLAICKHSTNEEFVKVLSDLDRMLASLVASVVRCAKSLNDGEFQRGELQTWNSEDGLINGEVCFVKLNDNGKVAITDVLGGLGKFLKEDKLKLEIYFDHKIKAPLKTILTKGNEIEQTYTLRLFHQLSFFKRISENMILDKELVDTFNTEELVEFFNIQSNNVNNIKKLILNNLRNNEYCFRLDDSSLTDVEKIENALRYLKKLNPQNLVDHFLAYEAIFLVGSLMERGPNSSVILDFDKNDCCAKLFADILLNIYNLREDIRSVNGFAKYKIDTNNQSSENLTQNDKRISLLGFVLAIINHLASESGHFNTMIVKHNVLGPHFKFIVYFTYFNIIEKGENDYVNGKTKINKSIEKIVELQLKNFTGWEFNIIDHIIVNLNVLSRCYAKNAQLWLILNVVLNELNYLDWMDYPTNVTEVLLFTVENQPSTELDAFITICNISTDDKIEKLKEIHKLVPMATKLLFECTACLNDETNKEVARERIQTLDDNETLVDGQICFIKLVDNSTVSLVTLLRCLFKLAVNTKLINEIYFKFKIKPGLKVIFLKGNTIEQRYALKLAYRLSIYKLVARDIRSDKEIVDYLKSEQREGEQGLGELKRQILRNLNPHEYSFQLDDTTTTDLRKIINAIEYLKDLHPKTVVDDKLAYEAVFLVGTLMKKQTEQILAQNCDQLFGNILLELFKVSSAVDFTKFKIDVKNQSSVNVSQNDQQISLMAFVLHIVNRLSSKSMDFSEQFTANSGGLDAHLGFLENEDIFTKIRDVRLRDFTDTETNFVYYLIRNLAVLSRSADKSPLKWTISHTVETLLKIAQQKPETELTSFTTICNVANDDELEHLPEIDRVCAVLTKIVDRCAHDFKKRKRLDRRRIQTWDDENRLIDGEAYRIELDDGTGLYITGVLRWLNKLSINEKISSVMYFKYRLVDSLKTILERGNDFEQMFALKLLAQLSFNGQVAREISVDTELLGYLKKIDSTENKTSSNKATKDNESLKNSILWNLKTSDSDDLIVKTKSKKSREARQRQRIVIASRSRSRSRSLDIRDSTQNAESVSRSRNTNEGEHIMISYNTGSRDLCLKIREDLEKNGHKVWIDVSNIHGSSLDSMANAVEKSYCVLMCVTEKYRQSPNCQLEAKYAFKLKKIVIPLIMEEGKENVTGWLGILMQDLIFVNFAKKSFDECIQRLKAELGAYGLNLRKNPNKPNLQSQVNNEIDNVNNNKNKPSLLPSPSQNITSTPRPKNVEDWSQNQVKEWLMDNKVAKAIVGAIFPCDGIGLKQLYEIKQTAPEFYFQTLNKSKNVEFQAISEFTNLIEKLFQRPITAKGKKLLKKRSRSGNKNFLKKLLNT